MEQYAHQIQYRIPAHLVSKINFYKTFATYIATHDFQEPCRFFTNQFKNYEENYRHHIHSALSLLHIDELINEYRQATQPQIWMTHGIEEYKINPNLDNYGSDIATLFPTHSLGLANVPSSCLIEFKNMSIKHIEPQRNRSINFTKCLSFATKKVHPHKFTILSHELSAEQPILGFRKILDWATNIRKDATKAITILSPCAQIHKLHDKALMPDLEFGWAPSTTFLDWLETPELLLDWTCDGLVRGYLCQPHT